jgi:hypothetical protein
MPFAQDWVTIAGVALAILALLFAGRQLREAQRNSRLQALMGVESFLEQHEDVHAKLRPGGAWSTPGTGPRSADEWVSVEQYMGMFERMKLAMIDDGMLDRDTFDRMYGYRILNIDHNDVIRAAKLENPELAPYWRDFIEVRDLIRELRHLEPRANVLPQEPRRKPSWIQRLVPLRWRSTG